MILDFMKNLFSHNLFFYYILIISLIAFIAMFWDKRSAQKGKMRIRERSLMGLAVLGGSFGILFGMYFFHHKTQKLLFGLGCPLIIGVQLIFLIYVLYFL